jgi:hypothetical protein
MVRVGRRIRGIAHTYKVDSHGRQRGGVFVGGRHQEVGVSMEITRAFKNEQIMSITGAFGVNSTTWSNKTNVRVEVLPLVKKERSHLHKMD